MGKDWQRARLTTSFPLRFEPMVQENDHGDVDHGLGDVEQLLGVVEPSNVFISLVEIFHLRRDKVLMRSRDE